MVNVVPFLPALVPLATLLWIRAADHSVTISRNNWDQEYDYIIGKVFLMTNWLNHRLTNFNEIIIYNYFLMK